MPEECQRRGAIVLYEPCIAGADGEGIAYQGGAFERREDAEAVLDVWRREGRHDPTLLTLNHVTLYPDVDAWEAHR